MLFSLFMAFARLFRSGRRTGIATGLVVAGIVATGTIWAGRQSGEPGTGTPAVTETLTITVPAASFMTDQRAGYDGLVGSNIAGAFVAIPAIGDGTPAYVWWSHDDQAVDPADWDTGELDGMTGIEVALGAGNHTASAVATATRSALSGTFGTVSGAGAEVVIIDEIDADAATTGTAFASIGARGQYGERHTVPSATNTITSGFGSHGTSPASDVRVNALGIYLSAHDVGEQVSLALYRGGAAASLASTTLLGSGLTTGTGTGWQWVTLDAPALLAASSSFRVVAKANTASTRTGFMLNGVTTGSDYTVQGLEIYDAAIDPSTGVAWPASLSGATISSTAPFFSMLAFSYEEAPYRGDGSWVRRVGVHSDALFGGSPQSALIIPDAAGANVFLGMYAPDAEGLELDGMAVAVGDVHTQQFRVGIYAGGAISDADGATLIWDGGQMTGSDTDEWVYTAAPTGASSVPVTAAALLWPTIRGNGGINIRYATPGNPEAAHPPDNPSDIAPIPTAFGEGPEYETNSSNPNHALDDATPYEALMVGDPDDFLPGNFPGIYYRVRVPGITLQAA